MTIALSTNFVTQTCCYQDCGITFAMTKVYDDGRRNDHAWWYCPNGHRQHYTGKSDEQKLRDAEAREVALKDQLAAAVHEAEAVRFALLRDRQRFANGVCPCCNRSFENVRRHMSSKHPDYDATRLVQPSAVKFKCGCGRAFESLRGLRTHQGHNRRDGWEKGAQSDATYWERRSAHLTDVGTSK